MLHPIVDVYFFHRVDNLNDNNKELELQQQQQQPNSTDNMNNDRYTCSTHDEQLFPDYDIPNDYMAPSCQDHTYTSLRNPEVVDHGYAKLVRSEQSIHESQGSRKQGSHEYDSLIKQDEIWAVPHKVHHYTSLTNLQPPTSHVYAERARSEEPTKDSTKNSHHCPLEYCTVIREDGKKVTTKFTVPQL